MLFVYMDFTTGGGWNDYRGQFASMELARDRAITLLREGGCVEAHVANTQDELIVLHLYSYRSGTKLCINEEHVERLVH